MVMMMLSMPPHILRSLKLNQSINMAGGVRWYGLKSEKWSISALLLRYVHSTAASASSTQPPCIDAHLGILGPGTRGQLLYSPGSAGRKKSHCHNVVVRMEALERGALLLQCSIRDSRQRASRHIRAILSLRRDRLLGTVYNRPTTTPLSARIASYKLASYSSTRWYAPFSALPSSFQRSSMLVPG